MATDGWHAASGDGTPAFGNARQLIRREGEYWTLIFEGVTCRLRDVRGLHHLALLLANPHQDISALVLQHSDSSSFAPDTVASAPYDARERARVNVTRAIGTVLRRLADHHPALAAHLNATLRTGVCCSYRPDPRLAVRWER